MTTDPCPDDLAAGNRRLASLVEKLRPYLRHDSFCPAAEGALAALAGPCDCGLADLLAEMDQ